MKELHYQIVVKVKEGESLIELARKRAVVAGTHNAEDAAECITEEAQALRYLLTDAALDLPVNVQWHEVSEA